MEGITSKCNWSQISLGVQEVNEIKYMLESLQNCTLCFHHQFSGYWTIRISTTSAAFASVPHKQCSHMLTFDALILWSGKHVFDMPWFKLSLSFSQLLSLALDLLSSLLCITSAPSLPLLCENCRQGIHCPNLSSYSFFWELFSPPGLSFWCTCLTAECGKLKKALDSE